MTDHRNDHAHEILEREVCYRGHFTLYRCRLRHRLFAGGWSPVLTRELIDRGHAVGVIPYDPVRDRVVMVEQFRVGAVGAEHPPWLLEFVAGLVGEGESDLEVAHREAREEADLELRDPIDVGRFYMSPGGSTERMRLFCARVDADRAGGIHGLAGEGEDIRVVVLDRAEALALPGRTPALSAWTVVGLQWLALHHERLRREWG